MPVVALVLGGVFVSESIAFFLIARGLRRGGRSLKDIGFASGATNSSYAIALLVAIVYCCGAIWAIPSIAAWVDRASYLKLLAVVAACMAGLFEETFFRGYVMTAVRDRGNGPVAQVVASGLLFGVFHAAWGLSGRFSFAAFVTPVAWTTGLGLALACAYLQAGRKLGPVVLSHALIDAVIEPGLLISAMGGQQG